MPDGLSRQAGRDQIALIRWSYLTKARLCLAFIKDGGSSLLSLSATNSHRIVTNFNIADAFVTDTLKVLPAAFRSLLVLTSVPGL